MNNNIKHLCILCKCRDFSIISNSVRDSKNHKIIKCLNCEHTQIYPIPTRREYAIFYKNSMQTKNIGQTQDINKLEVLSSYDTNRRSKLVSSLINKDHNILDIGTGHGFFVKEMIKNGYKIFGTEISQDKIPNSLKDNILNLDVLDKKTSISNQDCITLFFLLEHVTDPIKVCKTIKSMLSTNGIVVIEVPNLNCNLMQISEGYKDFFWQMAHINYFNERLLRIVLEEAGYKEIKIIYHQRYSIDNFMNWILNNKPQIDKPSFDKPLKYNELDEIYRSYLISKKESDTLIAIAKN